MYSVHLVADIGLLVLVDHNVFPHVHSLPDG